MSGIYAVFGRTLQVLRNSDQSIAGQANCVARIDQLRSVGWAKVSDPNYVKNLLSQAVASTSQNITVTREVITVYPVTTPVTSPTPSPTPTPAATTAFYTITRTSSNAPVLNPSSIAASALLPEKQLNFRILTEWQDNSGKIWQRELSTIVSKSGSR